MAFAKHSAMDELSVEGNVFQQISIEHKMIPLKDVDDESKISHTLSLATKAREATHIRPMS